MLNLSHGDGKISVGVARAHSRLYSPISPDAIASVLFENWLRLSCNIRSIYTTSNMIWVFSSLSRLTAGSRSALTALHVFMIPSEAPNSGCYQFIMGNEFSGEFSAVSSLDAPFSATALRPCSSLCVFVPKCAHPKSVSRSTALCVWCLSFDSLMNFNRIAIRNRFPFLWSYKIHRTSVSNVSHTRNNRTEIGHGFQEL